MNPQTAWKRWEEADKSFDRDAAAHLYRRLGFGAGAKTLQQAVDAGLDKTIDRLLLESDDSKKIDQERKFLERRILASGEPKDLESLWAWQMLHSPRQGLEKLILFWHGHFATSAAKVMDAKLMWQQHEIFRNKALGPFESLVQDIARDPAMLIYLDSTTNRRIHPNENFARELMELFCLGVGNYTERDIQEVARSFTGWEIQYNKFKFKQYQHDPGVKSFLGKSGKFNGDEAVKIITENPAASKFLVRKLVRFFVAEEPAIPEEVIRALAKEYQESQLDTLQLIKTICSSNLFFSNEVKVTKVRSPVELIVGSLRSLDGTCSTSLITESTADLGQELFHPPNVKGWDGGRAWINTNNMLGRTNHLKRILTHDKTRFAGLSDLSKYIDQLEPSSAEEQADWLINSMFAMQLPDNLKNDLVTHLKSQSKNLDQAVREAILVFSAMPEFHII